MAQITHNAWLLTAAAQRGDAEAVRQMLHHADNPCGCLPHHHWALLVAIRHEHADVVNALLPFANVSAHHSQALCIAVQMGCLDIVRQLLPVCDPRDHDSECLRMAAQSNRADLVHLLLPFSDAAARHSEALQWACFYRNDPLMDLLWVHSDPCDALSDMRAHPRRRGPQCCVLEQRILHTCVVGRDDGHAVGNAPREKRM